MATGIEFHPLVDGWVSEFELREAAVYCHYRPVDFWELPAEERALCVAQYRVHHLVELHTGDALNRAAEAKARRRGGNDG